MSRPECGDMEGKMVLCPLFKAFGSSNGQSWIRCESHVPDSNTVEIRYRNMEQCRIQRETFCNLAGHRTFGNRPGIHEAVF